MKFNIGDKLHISGDITVTGAHKCGDGIYSYNTDVGTFHEPELDKLVCAAAASVKPQDKPRFKAGDKAKVIANTCHHHMMIGDIVTLTGNTNIFASVLELPAWHYKERSPGFISERDLEPYAEPSMPTTPANKYEAMSDDELVCAVCDIGMCSTSCGNIRHADCPFKSTPAYNSATACSDFLHAHPEFRPVLVQYLLDEDAAKEPVKLYCVKSDKPGEWVTKGKIYEAAELGSIIFDNGWKSNYDFREGVPEEWKNNLVPLVSRPAKAGEWVLVNHISGDSGGISVGDIALVVMLNNGFGPYIRSKEKTIFGYNELGNVTLLKDDWCEVLDGYDGRYEPQEPKYWSGKVVCVETHDDFTVGKVYTFKDGKVTDDSCTRRPMSGFVAESLEDWNSRCGDCIVRFIEYKGEAT